MSGDRDKRTISPDPERMEVFIEAMTPPGPVHLQDLELEALAAGVPIIRPQTQNLLRFFLTMKRPSRILEIGTAVGFSALFMQHYAPAECRIITIEKDRVRAQKARENFARYGRISTEGGQTGITLMEGDAIEVLGGIREDESFDLVFMDAAKGQYIRFLPDAVRLLGSGGLLITDNILQEGEVLSSRFAVTRRNRTIHARMRTYIRALMEEERLETLLLPTGDGAAVSLKK
ncbi:MAG: O-methyltransferase [Lachnospiraceae bacterium]|nr:O-methyltransferase [Lachnospiraceae bacterium]